MNSRRSFFRHFAALGALAATGGAALARSVSRETAVITTGNAGHYLNSSITGNVTINGSLSIEGSQRVFFQRSAPPIVENALWFDTSNDSLVHCVKDGHWVPGRVSPIIEPIVHEVDLSHVSETNLRTIIDQVKTDFFDRHITG